MNEPMIQEMAEVRFVCSACTMGKHDKCKGDSWCDCQHRTKK